MMIHLGLQPGETVNILEELARLVETRWWENTPGQLESQVSLHTEE